MTSDQFEAREERIAICLAEKVSLAEAEAICNLYPELYGFREAA